MANAHLEVRCGECVALIGASGTGKSMLMRLICRDWRDLGR